MSSFIQQCEDLFSKIKQNRPIQECLKSTTENYDTIWFVYYMFFAIHNPKMEEYINKKASSTASSTAVASIIKNMIKRRHYTSTIVYQLYTHAYINNGNVTHIYPKYKESREILIKSYESNHLKTTAVHIRRAYATDTTTDTAATTPPASVSALLEHIIAEASAAGGRTPPHIQYKHKDIILLALICHMKIDEEDINTKSIFIAATPEDFATPSATPSATTPLAQYEHETSISPYDIKYKHLCR
jgi:hypothetical protein